MAKKCFYEKNGKNGNFGFAFKIVISWRRRIWKNNKEEFGVLIFTFFLII